MDSKIATLQKVEGIYDIQPIITPAFSSLETTVLLVLFTLFITANIYLAWSYLFSRKAKSIRKIHILKNRYSKNLINSHDAIYNLCFILRKGLQQKNLSIDTPLPKKARENKKRWGEFISELSNIRYKEDANASTNITFLFDESLFWLKR